jgi:hypothetical protein
MPRIKAQKGTDEANYGDVSYLVPADGVIDVPAEAAVALEATGGFVEVTDPAPVEDGLVRVKGHPDSACTINGVTYTAGSDGITSVPDFAVAALAAHGFTPLDA